MLILLTAQQSTAEYSTAQHRERRGCCTQLVRLVRSFEFWSWKKNWLEHLNWTWPRTKWLFLISEGKKQSFCPRSSSGTELCTNPFNKKSVSHLPSTQWSTTIWYDDSFRWEETESTEDSLAKGVFLARYHDAEGESKGQYLLKLSLFSVR